jgi:hypothetical protein
MSETEHSPLASSFSILISDLLKVYFSCTVFIRFHKIEYVCKVFSDMKKLKLSEILQLLFLVGVGGSVLSKVGLLNNIS